jgi:hypothetical protein
MICQGCGDHPALYIRRRRGRDGRMATIVRGGGGHDLCDRCARSERDRAMARGLLEEADRRLAILGRSPGNSARAVGLEQPAAGRRSA